MIQKKIIVCAALLLATTNHGNFFKTVGKGLKKAGNAIASGGKTVVDKAFEDDGKLVRNALADGSKIVGNAIVDGAKATVELLKKAELDDKNNWQLFAQSFFMPNTALDVPEQLREKARILKEQPVERVEIAVKYMDVFLTSLKKSKIYLLVRAVNNKKISDDLNEKIKKSTADLAASSAELTAFKNAVNQVNKNHGLWLKLKKEKEKELESLLIENKRLSALNDPKRFEIGTKITTIRKEIKELADSPHTLAIRKQEALGHVIADTQKSLAEYKSQLSALGKIEVVSDDMVKKYDTERVQLAKACEDINSKIKSLYERINSALYLYHLQGDRKKNDKLNEFLRRVDGQQKDFRTLISAAGITEVEVPPVVNTNEAINNSIKRPDTAAANWGLGNQSSAPAPAATPLNSVSVTEQSVGSGGAKESTVNLKPSSNWGLGSQSSTPAPVAQPVNTTPVPSSIPTSPTAAPSPSATPAAQVANTTPVSGVTTVAQPGAVLKK